MKYWRTADLDNTPNYLMHHGIQGQKWGVSHGPPYPLGSDVSTGNKLKTKVVSNLPHKRISANRMRNYTKSEQARISEGQTMGAMLGGLPGMMVGSYLTKRHINRENAGLRDKKYTNDERVRINNAYETTGLIGTAISRHNVKKENKQAAQKEALSVVDNMNGFNKEDFEVSKTKRTKDGNNYIIEVSHKEDPEMSMFVKVTKDKNSGKMSVSNIGLTEEDAKSGSKGSNAEKIKAKSDSYDTKPATNEKKTSTSKAPSSKSRDDKQKNAIVSKMNERGGKFAGIDKDSLTRVKDSRETYDNPNGTTGITEMWTDGHGNYFTLEITYDPKTKKETIDQIVRE